MESLPTNEISNNISMTNDQSVRVFFLFSTGPMEVFSESSFNPSAVLKKLLQKIECNF